MCRVDKELAVVIEVETSPEASEEQPVNDREMALSRAMQTKRWVNEFCLSEVCGRVTVVEAIALNDTVHFKPD